MHCTCEKHHPLEQPVTPPSVSPFVLFVQGAGRSMLLTMSRITAKFQAFAVKLEQQVN